MLDKSVERSVQTAPAAFNIFENKVNVAWMLNESLNRFQFDSTRLQHLFKRPQHLVQQSVERILR